MNLTAKDIFQQLQSAVRAGVSPQEFPTGTVIPDLWTDLKTQEVYQMPLIVVGYCIVKPIGRKKCLGAILLRQNASPDRLPFDENACNVFHGSSLERWQNSDNGYPAGCSAGLLAAVTEVEIDKKPTKFFPPSLEELGIGESDSSQRSQLIWEYFRKPCDSDGHDAPYDLYFKSYRRYVERRTFRNTAGEPQCCWLRGPNRGHARYAWCYLTNHEAVPYNVCSPTPYLTACVIC